jgi:hypothetical protein
MRLLFEAILHPITRFSMNILLSLPDSISGILGNHIYITFQLSDRSYMPLVTEAGLESLVCKVISKVYRILNSDIKMKIDEKLSGLKILY